MQHNNEKTIIELENKLEYERKKFLLIGLTIVVLGIIMLIVSSIIENGVIFGVSIAMVALYCVIMCVCLSKSEKEVRIARGYYIEDRIKYFVDSRGKVTHKVIGKVVFDE